MAKEATEKTPFLDIMYLCKNTLFCFLTTGVLLLIGAVAATYLSLAEGTIGLLVTILTDVCIFLGGFRGAKNSGRQGLVQGGIFGVVYMAILTLIGMLICGRWSGNLDIHSDWHSVWCYWRNVRCEYKIKIKTKTIK